MEQMWRAASLHKVYHAFDFDGGGQVGEAALLEIGRARRRLGQREGEWSEETNSALLSLIGTDAQGMCMLLVLSCVIHVACFDCQETFQKQTSCRTSWN